MAERYTIDADDRHGLLTITLRGFWDEQVLSAYIADVDAAANRLSCGAGRHRVIVDLTDFAVQSQAVLGLMMMHLRTAKPGPARMTWVTRGGLQRLQSARSIAEFDGRLFDTLDEAWRWTLGDEDGLPIG